MKQFLLRLGELFLIAFTSFLVGALLFTGILYVKSIKTEIIAVQASLEEIYDAQATQYSEMLKIYAVQTYMIMDLNKNLEEVKAESVQRDTFIVNSIAHELRHPEYADLKSHTVMIIAEDKINPEEGSLGTGVVIKVTDESTFIVTNKHVCDDTYKNNCYVSDPETKAKYPITVVKRHTGKHDVQIVKVSGTMPGKVPIKRIKEVVHQDKIYVVGHYLGNEFFYAEGVVAGFSRKDGDLVIAAPTGPGNSGSAIITQDGYLTGLLYAGNIVGEFPFMTWDLTHSLCVNSKVLQLFLAGYVE